MKKVIKRLTDILNELGCAVDDLKRIKTPAAVKTTSGKPRGRPPGKAVKKKETLELVEEEEIVEPANKSILDAHDKELEENETNFEDLDIEEEKPEAIAEPDAAEEEKEKVKAAARELIALAKRKKVKPTMLLAKVLKPYEVEELKDLAPENYDAFIKTCDKYQAKYPK